MHLVFNLKFIIISFKVIVEVFVFLIFLGIVIVRYYDFKFKDYYSIFLNL